ncbi:MAG: type II toxin-antitoxin system VapB family antitoxin [Desulfobacteraceae bacterium]|nr:MAG: type II toxin-antitoxin system VapB family antitoxin [Desulfobacteraceae bacterium]
MRTNIEIDDKLIHEAMTLSNLKTKKAVVESGLKLLVQIKKQEQIKKLRGKLKWDGDHYYWRFNTHRASSGFPLQYRF